MLQYKRLNVSTVHFCVSLFDKRSVAWVTITNSYSANLTEEEWQIEKQKEADRSRVSQSLCLYSLPLGFMEVEKKGISGNLMSIHAMHIHLHARNPPTRCFSSLCCFSPSFPSPPAVSVSSDSLLWLIPYHRVKNIPHSKGKKATKQTCAKKKEKKRKKKKCNHCKHRYTNRQQSQAPCPYTKVLPRPGSWRLPADHCDPAILAACSQDISAQH